MKWYGKVICGDVTSITFYGEGEQDINLQLRVRRILVEKKLEDKQGLAPRQ